MNEMYRSLPEKLKEVSIRFADSVAFEYKTEGGGYVIYSYREFYEMVEAISASLSLIGIKKGDRVAIILENRPEWGAIYFAIVSMGAIAVPLDAHSTQNEIEYLLGDSGSRICFASGKLLTLLSGSASLKKIIAIDHEKNSGKVVSFSEFITQKSKKVSEKPQVAGDDIASIVYTSGTTGGAKGVMLTHRNFLSNFKSVEALRLITPRDNILSILPLHHVFPFMVTLIIPLFLGARVTYIYTLKSDELLLCMREKGVTLLIGVPQLFNLFYKHMYEGFRKINFLVRFPLLGAIEFMSALRSVSKVNISRVVLATLHRAFGKKLRFFVSGGAPLNKQTANFLTKVGFRVLEGYGLTETSPIVTMNPPAKQKIGSVGKVIEGVYVKIDGADENGVGEIQIKGPNVMVGYYKKEEQTREVFKDGWFCSGDLGYIDNDGYLYITGRKKEIIVLGSGKNISPVELETYYSRSSFIKEVCILGIGEREEEYLGAVIVPDLNYIRNAGEINIHAAIKWELEQLSKELPPYKRITNFIIVNEELPRTRLEKIKRFEAKKRYKDKFKGVDVSHKDKTHPTEEEKHLLSTQIGSRVVELLSRELKIKRDIRLADHLELDFGVDSLGRVELLAALEEAFSVTVPEAVMGCVYTVEELISALEKLLAGQSIGKGATKLPGSEIDLWGEILSRTPPKEVARKVDVSYKRILRLWTVSVRIGLYMLFKLLWRLRVIGTDNLPEDKTFILCPNHVSYLDGFIISASIPFFFRRDVYLLGQQAYFEGPLLKKFTKLIRVIPIDLAKNLVITMQTYAYLLRKGSAACIFPEGARSIDGDIKEFKKGVGILSKELGVPLVPVYIRGAYEAWPRTKNLPKSHPVTVVFSRPYLPGELCKIGFAKGAKSEYEAIAIGIREKVLELKKEYERGCHA
ncbi:MAG: AMP-binding protein [bacterium]